MTTIALICPKCKKVLHTEEESRYYSTSYGCTIACYSCGLSLIGVDLSVCARCGIAKKRERKCETKFTAFVKVVK